MRRQKLVYFTAECSWSWVMLWCFAGTSLKPNKPLKTGLMPFDPHLLHKHRLQRASSTADGPPPESWLHDGESSWIPVPSPRPKYLGRSNQGKDALSNVAAWVRTIHHVRVELHGAVIPWIRGYLTWRSSGISGSSSVCRGECRLVCCDSEAVVQRDVSTKLSASYVATPTREHDLWVATERIRWSRNELPVTGVWAPR